jgi:hypothetical protein
MGFPPTTLSVGPVGPAGASAATANSAVKKPIPDNTAMAAISTTLFIPNPSFIKITTTITDGHLILKTMKATKQLQGSCSHE